MRCPKCGFISFDHLSSCAKCGRDIAEVAAELQGTSIQVEIPMFLSGAIAALAESDDSFEELSMESDTDEGIDFDMDMDSGGEAAVEMDADEDVDFSFDDEAAGMEVAAEEADINLAEPEEPEAAGKVELSLADEEAETVEAGPDETAGPALEVDSEEKLDTEEAVEAIEELDFLGAIDDDDEAGLEFDLEDFMEDMDEDKKSSSDE